MKILFLGYKPFLSAILNALDNTNFIEANKIDVIIAEPNTSKSLINGFKRLVKQKNFRKILEELVLRFQLLLFKTKNKDIIKHLHEEISLDKLKNRSNISFIEYKGLENIKNLENYDFMIVASFGIKIPEHVFNAPKRRTLNIHPSYLPELRGGYPTYISAFLDEQTAACTIHYMEKGWDNGDIIIQEKKIIAKQSSNEIRFNESAKIAAKLLNDLNACNFAFESKKQEKRKISYCHKILKYKNNIKNIKKNRLEGYVLANCSKSLYPYTYGYYKGFLVLILVVEKLGQISDNSKIKFYRKQNQLCLQHYDINFLVIKYIYKGKLISI